MLKSVTEIRETTELAIEAAKIRAEQERVQALMHLAKVTADTVAFCETVVADAIEHAAQDGRDYISHWRDEEDIYYGVTDSNGIARLVALDGKVKYANGKPSRSAHGREIVPTIMYEYLRAHGYKVGTHVEYFQHYGFGDRKGYHLEVSWGN